MNLLNLILHYNMLMLRNQKMKMLRLHARLMVILPCFSSLAPSIENARKEYSFNCLERLKLSPESERRKEQEQAALQAQLKYEKEQAQKDRDFAARAMDVATSAHKPSTAPATKKCGRCDKGL